MLPRSGKLFRYRMYSAAHSQDRLIALELLHFASMQDFVRTPDVVATDHLYQSQSMESELLQQLPELFGWDVDIWQSIIKV